ncbi:hypothetical protein [Nocardioides gilvus]|uniref:hypothetical protein n=1 Tax=Nocardioides gilvus TaxID=1735589 RepID=UPI000D74FE0D|nr:hypothetical protein [Nocardioides gilvus]
MSVRLFSRSRTTVRGVALVAAAFVLAGCSAEPEEGGEEVADAPRETVKISITDDGISPLGERIDFPRGQSVPIEITADREGSLHVHSTPEQELEFIDGVTAHDLVIDQPGIVEVELHDPDVVVMQLEVR